MVANGRPQQRFKLQDLITRVRSLVEPNRHPKTAEALDQLQIAVKSWADQIARFVLCLIFLNFLLAAISRPPQPYFSYIVLGSIFKPAQVKSEFKYTSRKSLLLNGKALRNKVQYMKKRITALEEQVKRHTETKTSMGRLTKEWILRVFLASPHASSRAIADSFHQVVGLDATTVSRTSIGRIKAAWVEMFVRMVKSKTRDAVAAHLRSCSMARRPFLPVTLVHVQDEADMRLRSGDARDAKLPTRGRASKVQLHVLRLAAGHHDHEIPTELEALGDKSASTLATSLERLTRNTIRDIFPQLDHNEAEHTVLGRVPEIWVIHLLIGDAIPTNDAAARVLWASVKENPLGQRIRYFLVVMKCMTHQTGLSAKSGVIGPAASSAGGHDLS